MAKNGWLAKTLCLLLTSCLLIPMNAFAQQGGRQRRDVGEGGRAAPAGQAATPPSGSAANAAPAPAGEGEAPRPTIVAQLPPDRTTTHKLATASGEISFTATAGTIPLFNEETGAVLARLGYIAFVKSDTDVRRRPVTFLWNGGPGYASAWLNLGAIGPWRVDLETAARAPSLAQPAADNPQSWLEFTDLVFIDPAGTGFGRIYGGDQARSSLWGVEGDAASLAAAVRRWLVNNNRLASPKFIGGESYGGFRAPKVARRLINDEGIAINGLVVISPVLDFNRFNARDLLRDVARLPSYAAVGMEKNGPVTAAQLASVENYAQGEFISDLLKGYGDAAALERLTTNVSRLTGLERGLVARLGGRVPVNVFRREIEAAQGRIVSLYDGTFSGLDPNPFSRDVQADDQLLRGLHAPLVTAMLEIYRTKLDWLPANARYQFQNIGANSQWNWGRQDEQNAANDLARSLALDANMRALIVHGRADLITPYFESRMVLAQTPIPVGARLTFKTYNGGHMFYSREESRREWREDVRALMEAASPAP